MKRFNLTIDVPTTREKPGTRIGRMLREWTMEDAEPKADRRKV